ncbi:transposase [Prosthecobacter sp. SYSU 5D2]|uniref:transposase n=1 Tax=Prosthecobacter sp. SYSU 5D2 TaxID=3134134 RepID=UPI0031FED360
MPRIGAINEHWPEAALVFNHFHIIKLPNELPPDRQILSYYDHPISSGIMEDINNKIRRLLRMAYGCRDVDFLHLCISTRSHESEIIFTGF